MVDHPADRTWINQLLESLEHRLQEELFERFSDAGHTAPLEKLGELGVLVPFVILDEAEI